MARTGWYDSRAPECAIAYESLDAVALNGWLSGLIPERPGLVIDIGAGTGRDAAWLATVGHESIAVEPSAAMRAQGTGLHSHPRLRWMDDSLPELPRLSRLGLSADLIVVNGVWQHLAAADRPRALRKMAALLRSGGVLAITLRHGPSEPERQMHPVSRDELERLAQAAGMYVERVVTATDALGREGVTWTNMALRLPDDGTGALPLLRHLILHDDKSSTYKLGLLRALCRAADSSAGLARDGEGGHVEVPLGLVALNWLRLYLPLVKARLPQMPGNAGPDGLAFAKEGFRKLLGGAATPADLRVGARLDAGQASAVEDALWEAVHVIHRMPAHYLTFPNGGVVFPVTKLRRAPGKSAAILDGAFFRSFGSMLVPTELWRAMQRFSVWVEPALVIEWSRLMKEAAGRQGQNLDEGVMAAALTWSDPDRGVGFTKRVALARLEEGRPLACVWTGRMLGPGTLDIDHCLPWSAWPCGSLFNLVPSHRTVNQSMKRQLLPSAATLLRSRDAIRAWWQDAYIGAGNAVLGRFRDEASASLPELPAEPGEIGTEAVFAGLELQRLRLSLDQRVPEWAGVS